MNQILDYNPNSRVSKSSGSDKIVKFFAIILIIFALVLIGVVGYGMIANKKKANDIAAQATYANIAIETNDTEATIKVTHDKNIQKLIYSWNTSSERTIKGSDKYIEEVINIPKGENTLHVKVIDEIGTETTHDEEIFSENGVDIIFPTIELSVTEEKKLKITVTDETALDFMTYRWNEENEETVYADEGSKEIVTEIEILKGENDLTVVAVDGSKNTTTETKSFTGLTKPEIIVTLSEDGSQIFIKAVHENGIESMSFTLNDQNYNVDLGGQTPPTIEVPAQQLKVGYNRIIITVKSVDGTETKFDGECTYGDSGNTNDTNSSNEDSQEQSSDNNTQENE